MRPAFVPQAALATVAAIAIAAFVLLLGTAAFNGADLPALDYLPVAFVIALWLVPAALAAARGERWAFVAMLAMLIFLSDATFRARNWSDKTIDWQVALRGGAWAAAGAMGLMHLGAVKRGLTRPPAVFLGLFVAFMLISASWSPVATYSLTSGLGFVFCLVFALAAVDVLDETDVMLGLAIGYALLIVPSLMVAPFSNSLAGPSPGSTATIDRLAGITDHPIGLGQACASGIFLSGLMLARKIGPRWIWWGIIAAAVGGLLLSRSRMPAVGMLFAWALVYSHRRGALAQFLMALLAVATAAGLIIVGIGFENLIPKDILRLASRSGEAREVLTLTGRLDIWKLVVHKVAEAPWLGHGYASGNFVLHDFVRWHLTHAHNGYLQAVLYLGLVGLALVLVMLAGQIRAFVASPMLGRDTLTIYIVLLSLTEQGALSNVPGTVTLMWMLAIGMCARRDAWKAKWSPGELESVDTVGRAVSPHGHRRITRGGSAAGTVRA